MIIGAYAPGTTLIHRAPAGPKLAVLAVLVTAVTAWRDPRVLGTGLVVLALTAAIARIRPRVLWRQVRYPLLLAALVGLGQLWFAGPRIAVLVSGSIAVAVVAATLVTLTTRTTDLIDAIVRGLGPLRRLGVDVDRFALLLALTVRAIPVIARLAEEVRDARRARGAERSVRAFAVPLVIRTVRHADRLGDALTARGVDD